MSSEAPFINSQAVGYPLLELPTVLLPASCLKHPLSGILFSNLIFEIYLKLESYFSHVRLPDAKLHDWHIAGAGQTMGGNAHFKS